MPHNRAAWALESRGRFVVKEASYRSPDTGEIVIKAGAVAANPLDYKASVQLYDPIPSFVIHYPTIFGSDVAGTIVEVGSDVKDVKIGDRVMSHQSGLARSQPWASAFQNYVVAETQRIVKIPEHISFVQACVLPLSCDTAMTGLYVDCYLALQLPSKTPKPQGKTLLVWGGSSSVGCSVIQMAVASGYRVIAVASRHNHALCKSLGAAEVFDREDPALIATIVEAVKDADIAGAYDCIGHHDNTTIPCANILAQCKGSKKVVSVLTPKTGIPEGVTASRVHIAKMLGTSVPATVRAWMTEALESGQLVARPEPIVVGSGLELCQQAVDMVGKGLSAAKAVVQLD